ncbi:hypothetical protein EUTSA_v10009936mg [Eutrema salsugineum]|uniref:Uncharacterized protein n=1 Tax=Eutrema salsugineum TaxID=72664 RepID=V4KVR1_EUTSA|nr:hypothetical protein EUTSA_v10009936mg [Eutrema salsugineum]
MEEEIHKPNCKRNVSGELDVFEATRYFSDFNEPTTIEYSRIQTQKQSTITEIRQNRVHPETENQLPEPRAIVKEMTRDGGGKLTSFLNSLLRSAGLKKPKPKVKVNSGAESPRGERRRRKSCVMLSPISGAGAWSLNARRRSFDERHVKDSKKSDQKLNMRLCESLCPDQKVECKDRNAKDDDVNGGCESDSNSESDLFELDLFAKSNP